MSSLDKGSKIVLINRENLINNISFLRSKVRSKIYPVLKSNAYGHGILNVSEAIEKYCDGFCVGTIDEAIKVREVSSKNIIILKGTLTKEEDEIALRERFTPMVYDISDIEKKSKMGVNMFLKIDTGMGRLGILPAEVEKIPTERLKNVIGLSTHFAYSDISDKEFTEHQIKVFTETSAKIERISKKRFLKTMANSAGSIFLQKAHFDIVRPGIALYGISPIKEDIKKIEPVMTVKARVISVKDLPTGWGVGYSRKFITREKTRVGVLSIGYAQGVLRALSEKTFFKYKNQNLKSIGFISMDMCMFICNNVNIQRGDEVLILGKDENGEIKAQQLADLINTNPYEILCSLGI